MHNPIYVDSVAWLRHVVWRPACTRIKHVQQKRQYVGQPFVMHVAVGERYAQLRSRLAERLGISDADATEMRVSTLLHGILTAGVDDAVVLHDRWHEHTQLAVELRVDRMAATTGTAMNNSSSNKKVRRETELFIKQ